MNEGPCGCTNDTAEKITIAERPMAIVEISLRQLINLLPKNSIREVDVISCFLFTEIVPVHLVELIPLALQPIFDPFLAGSANVKIDRSTRAPKQRNRPQYTFDRVHDALRLSRGRVCDDNAGAAIIAQNVTSYKQQILV